MVIAGSRPSDRELSAWLVSRRQQGRADQWDWLAGIEALGVTPLDLFEAAMGGESTALGGLKLRRLLRALGHGQATTSRLLRLISDDTASTNGRVTREPTVAWLVDPLASGGRLAVWVDVVETLRTSSGGRSIPPWPGFPYRANTAVPVEAAPVVTVPAEDVPAEAVPGITAPSPWDDFGQSGRHPTGNPAAGDPWATFGRPRVAS